jgi:hypothetical protein
MHFDRGRKTQHPDGSTAANTARKVLIHTLADAQPAPVANANSKSASVAPGSSLTRGSSRPVHTFQA